jgi:hypothetical protein
VTRSSTSCGASDQVHPWRWGWPLRFTCTRTRAPGLDRGAERGGLALHRAQVVPGHPGRSGLGGHDVGLGLQLGRVVLAQLIEAGRYGGPSSVDA